MMTSAIASMVLAVVSAGAAAVGLPVETRIVAPERFVTNGNGRVFVDFGKDAFGWLELLPPPGFTGGVYQVMVGEAKVPGESINWWAGGSIRTGWNKDPAFMPPCDVFRVPFEADKRNTRTDGPTPAVQMRPEIGVVQPFRYAEFFEIPFEVTPERVRQVAVNYPMDMTASSFESSSPILNAVYGFCKYSILATSFAGLYVDGDRERIPYEGDAYINQLGHYAVDCDTRLARATLDYLMEHPTWPTEWKQHAIMMAWADWMWSGETVSLERFYDRLKNDKLMLSRARGDGLLTSLPQKISSQDDLIDWPPADRDGFEFRSVNAVVNAFHYRNLVEMTDIARVLGKEDDVRFFEARAASLRDAYRRTFLDAKRGLCVDGEGSAHASLHANAAALAFGLLDQGEERTVADYLAGRGMACSTYFSQYLMEALFRGGRADAAVALMSARGDRSWYGMMEQGATMTMEAWSLADKPNQDWNHAWGTVPLNVISRLVLGVTPLDPGFERISIRPNAGGLERVKGVVPTVKGSVSIEIQGERLTVTAPAPSIVIWRGRQHEISAGSVEIGGSL